MSVSVLFISLSTTRIVVCVRICVIFFIVNHSNQHRASRVQELDKLTPKWTFWGRLHAGGPIAQEGQWKEGYWGEKLGQVTYPVFAFGAGYVMSHDIAVCGV